jgi:hypothetical protein
MECIRCRDIGNMATLAVLMAAISLAATAQQAVPSSSTQSDATKQGAQLAPNAKGDNNSSQPQEPLHQGASNQQQPSSSTQANSTKQGVQPAPNAKGDNNSSAQPQEPLSVEPSELQFGRELLGSESAVQTVRLTATSKSQVSVHSTVNSDDFHVDPQDCSIDPGMFCALKITFAPKQLALTTAAIKITPSISGVASSPLFVWLKGEGTARCNAGAEAFTRDWFKALAPVLTVVILYLLGIVLVRWNMVARPTRKLLQAQIDAVRAEVASLNLDATDVKRQQVLDLLTLAESPFLKGSFSKGLQAQASGLPARQRVYFADYFFWTRGEEIAAWGYVHEAEELLADLLPAEPIRARLENAEQQLRQLNTPTATALAERIHESLAAPTVSPELLRDAVQQTLQHLAPESNDLLVRIDRALADQSLRDPASTLPADWKDVLQQIQDTLLPKADALAATIDATLLVVLPADTEILKQLQKDLGDRIKSPAAQLKSSLQTILAAQGAGNGQTPAQPPSVADWLSLLRVASDLFTTYTDQLAARVRVALAQPPALPLDRWRALLREALGIIYDNSDRDYSDFMSWQNKAVWLTGCGLLFIVTLAATLQHGGLLLVGAVGGLLSRLSRSLRRANVPTDYGASWTTLFLSPVVGALAGWSGVLLVILAVQLNVLGPLFKTDWCNPWSPLTLGIAFLLGFSERAFDSILTQLEDKTQAQAQTKAAQAQELSITTGGTLTPGKVSSPYSQVLAASGGTAPYKWTLIAGRLPDGLNLDQTGTITGTPSAAGTLRFTLQVSDTASKTKSQEFTIVVA